MAALKVEWLAELRARDGVPPLARGIGDFRRLAGLASPLAPLVNALAKTGVARRVTDRLGVAHERPLPAFARRPLSRRTASPAGRRAAAAIAGRDASPASGGEAVLFATASSSTRNRASARRSAALLRRRRRRPRASLDAGCCGRTALSTGQIDKSRATARARSRPLSTWLAPATSCCSSSRAAFRWSATTGGGCCPATIACRRGGRRQRPALELVAELAAQGAPALSRPAARALLHSHCHEKALAVRGRHRAGAAPAVPGLELRGRSTPAAAACRASSATRPSTTSTSVAIAERVAAAGGPSGAAGHGRAGDRHVVPVADPRPRRPRRPAPARVPRRAARLLPAEVPRRAARPGRPRSSCANHSAGSP